MHLLSPARLFHFLLDEEPADNHKTVILELQKRLMSSVNLELHFRSIVVQFQAVGPEENHSRGTEGTVDLSRYGAT